MKVSFARQVKEEVVFNDFDICCQKAILSAIIKVVKNSPLINPDIRPGKSFNNQVVTPANQTPITPASIGFDCDIFMNDSYNSNKLSTFFPF